VVNTNYSLLLALLLIVELGWSKMSYGRIYMFSLLALFGKSGKLSPC
jgi:hypothetical protein